MSLPRHNDRALPTRGLITRIVERFNPGVTLLVLLWTAAFAVRERLEQRGMLERTADDALRSLLYVVPTMLVGWGVLILADRRFGLGLFGKSD